MAHRSQPPPPPPRMPPITDNYMPVPVYMQDYNCVAPPQPQCMNVVPFSQHPHIAQINPNFMHPPGIPQPPDNNVGNRSFGGPFFVQPQNNSSRMMHLQGLGIGSAEEVHLHNPLPSFSSNRLPPPAFHAPPPPQWHAPFNPIVVPSTQNENIYYENCGTITGRSVVNTSSVEFQSPQLQGNVRGTANNQGGNQHITAQPFINSQANLVSQVSCNKAQIGEKDNSIPREELSSTINIPERGRERIHNDYNQHFVDTGERSQNFIRDAEESERFAEYPKLDKLMQLKKEVNIKRGTPAQHIQANLRSFDVTSLKTKFDVILVDPPWAEYNLRVAGGFSPSEDLTAWTLDDMKEIRVDLLGETPSFCFLWCAVTHLEEARALLSHWGYRRCEDICWLKTNKRLSQKRREGSASRFANVIHDEHSLLQRSKEHCLMGIKGTVRRSIDTHFIHANLDTDVIVDEEPEELGSTAKPKELYDIIERFCLGRKRIELFGTDRNIRNGWVTIGKSISFTNFDADAYNSWFDGDVAWPEVQDYRGGKYTGSTTEIEQLRPKSPPRAASRQDETTGGTNQSSSSNTNQNTKRQRISDD